jgi:uncharacterized MAPEG superfamily protein
VNSARGGDPKTCKLRRMTLAYWCVVVAGCLPYLATGVAKLGDRTFDNANPRAWLAKQEGYRARANAAQLNSFEAFPLFAAAVIIAHLRAGPQPIYDQLAMAFVSARLAYIGLYVANLASLRSVAWFVGMCSALALFFL